MASPREPAQTSRFPATSLLAGAQLDASSAGRNGIYDVTARRAKGTVIAEFRGHSRSFEGRPLSQVVD
jgi:acyl-CoA thioesterase